MDLLEYQRQAARTDQHAHGDADPLLLPLLGLASEIGTLQGEFKKRLRDGVAHQAFQSKIADDLGDILWYAAAVASRLGLNLADIATDNLAKTQARWLPRLRAADAAFYDDEFPAAEQLPRRFTVMFAEIDTERGMRVQMTLDGVPVGAPLSDRAYEEIGYRWHDALHLAYVACLGWSPTMRGLMGRRRKSKPLLDEIEDGGRAVVLDEGIAAFTYDYARQHRYLDGVTAIDDHLLKTIRSAVVGLEVEDKTAADWEHAILQGFTVFRQLWHNNGGTVTGDLHARTLTFHQQGDTRATGRLRTVA